MDGWWPDPIPTTGGRIVGMEAERAHLVDGVPTPDGPDSSEPKAVPPRSAGRMGVETLEGLEPKVTEEHFAVRNRDSRPDISADAFAMPGAVVRAASVRGLAHRYYGDPRQDAYAVRVSDDDRWLVIAVADGLSSCINSHEGSEFAARTAARFVSGVATQSDLVGVAWHRLFEEVSVRLGDRARRLADASTGQGSTDGFGLSEEAARSMSTTLTVVAVPLAHDPARHAIAAWIGDSGVWRLRSGRWETITPLKSGEEHISSSNVDALPWASGGEPTVVEFPVDPGDVVVVATDGIGDLLGAGATPQAEFLAKRWSEPPAAPQFVAEVDLRVQSFDDDRTAVAVWIDGSSRHTSPGQRSGQDEWMPPDDLADVRDPVLRRGAYPWANDG